MLNQPKDVLSISRSLSIKAFFVGDKKIEVEASVVVVCVVSETKRNIHTQYEDAWVRMSLAQRTFA